ncbi:hypothetical protein AAZX31_03G022300 [Glycine max]|nr:hypothetical protein JHK86_006145 [Glycine max]
MLKALAIVIVFLMMIMRVPAMQINEQENGGRKNIVVGAEDDNDGILGDKKTVRVLNGMNDGILVYLHCKSKDDDFHQHVLAVGEYQEWSFRDNIAGTTLYWCTMDANTLHASFEIYNAKRDDSKCDSQCNRTMKNDGGYFYNQFQGRWEKMLFWNIPKLAPV